MQKVRALIAGPKNASVRQWSRRMRRGPGGHILRFLVVAVSVLPGVSVLSGCKCQSETDSVVDAGRSPARQARCDGSESGERFTIEGLGDSAGSLDRALPFAVELGNAVTWPSGFAITYTRGDGRQAEAGVALLDQSAGSGRLLELARLHGDTAPPRVAKHRDELVVAVAMGDASGGALRLVGVSPGGISGEGVEADMGVDDSPAFDLGLGQDSGVVVWDEWDKGQNVGYVVAQGFSLDNLEARGSARRLSPPSSDVEMPRLVRRPNGYWLAWRALGQPDTGSQGDGEGLSVLEYTPSWVELMPLSADASAAGEPLAVTDRSGFVQGFDLIPGHGGSALLVWRSARSTPGTRGGVIRIARVFPDGTTEVEFIEDQNVGTGVPQFLFDRDPRGGAPHGWLVIDGASGWTRFAGLSPLGQQLEMLEGDSSVGVGSLLAAHHGRLLLAAPRGRNMDLSLVRCGDGTPMPSARRRDGGGP